MELQEWVSAEVMHLGTLLLVLGVPPQEVCVTRTKQLSNMGHCNLLPSLGIRTGLSDFVRFNARMCQGLGGAWSSLPGTSVFAWGLRIDLD